MLRNFPMMLVPFFKMNKKTKTKKEKSRQQIIVNDITLLDSKVFETYSTNDSNYIFKSESVFYSYNYII